MPDPKTRYWQVNTGRKKPAPSVVRTGFLKRATGEGLDAWNDVLMTPAAFSFAGVGDPELIDWQPGGSGTSFKVYAFQSGDEGFFTIQLPHSYYEGQDLYAHLHWTPHSRGVAENGHTVNWRLDYSWANINGTFGASATVDLTDTVDGTNHKHQMTPDTLLTGAGAGKTISSILVCRVYRLAGDTWAGVTAAQSPVLIDVDFHVPLNTVGSQTHAIK